LLLIPICFAEPETAELGYDCDEDKCTFSLLIPKAAVTFVDVSLLTSEIDMLNGNCTDLTNEGDLVANQTVEFQNDFNALCDETNSTLNEMFANSEELKKKTSSLLKKANTKEDEALSLKDALQCMVNGGDPATCYTPPSNPPSTAAPETTETPDTTEAFHTTSEGSGDEGSGEGSGDGKGEDIDGNSRGVNGGG
ncbi:hypothetical protein PMAYCL1PPCAC_27684, partial [Pristionchus mayeri]